MKNDNRSSDEIEREIVHERAQMSDTIDDLQKKFSVEAIVSDVRDMFRGQGADLGRAISQTVGRNPAAVVLVGVGLAWLFLGQNGKPTANATVRQSGQASGRRDGQFPSTRQDNNDRYWYGDSQISGNRHSPGRGGEGETQGQWGADEASTGVTGSIRDAAATVGDTARHAATSLGHTASDLTQRLSEGLHDLSDEAKARVVSARRAAHEARVSSEALMKRGSRGATDFFEDQPLVVGALAVALGAAIGSALPHSRLEDETMGESSDQLFADAQAMFREERDKAMAVVKSAARDVKDEIGQMGSDLRSEVGDMLPDNKNLGDTIVDRTTNAASRVIEGAKDEAKHQGLGRRNT